MKRGKLVLLAVLCVFIALGSIAWEEQRLIVFLVMFAMEPPGWGCDEGPVTDRSATNARGDVVEEYIKACTGIGTVVDYSITLRLHGDEKTTRLVEQSDTYDGFPKFRWIDDDMLIVDLGKVSWIRSPVHKTGGIKITYVYSIGVP
jgi:hypothetical protein